MFFPFRWPCCNRNQNSNCDLTKWDTRTVTDENYEKVLSGYRFIGQRRRCLVFLNTCGHIHQEKFWTYFELVQGAETEHGAEHVIWPPYAVQ